jgi:ubiquinone/menaquinone biosynthesis C-methylase UbiE
MADQHPRHPIFARLWEHVIAPISTWRGANEHRRELLDGLAGRVIEVGAGQGTNFPQYPPSVECVVAIEPEDYLRHRAERAAVSASIPVSVLDGKAEDLPGEDGSFDAGVVSLVLCSVPDQGHALGELCRVIKPGGELRFYEHVISRRAPYAYIQRFEEATFWPRLLGGCHPARDTSAAIVRAGFVIERCERFAFSPVPLFPMPHILGVARRPG